MVIFLKNQSLTTVNPGIKFGNFIKKCDEVMKNKIQLLPSGISFIDNAWGGFYRGGTYLLIGPKKSGRTLLGLQYAMECASNKEVCLYFTSMRPKDLMIQAASIDFDLQHYMNQNFIIVVRVASPTDLYEVDNPDSFLVEYLNDIVALVEQYRPNKIVFDELTPFIGFNDIGLLKEVFGQTIEGIEENGITSLFVLGDPVTPLTNSIVDALAFYSTGIIYLQKNEEEVNQIKGGTITITPNIGHPEGKFTSNYYIEPYKGVTADYHPKQTITQYATVQARETHTKYRSLADIYTEEEQFSFPNYYSENDFYLILNNQIALYKSTGQLFTVISFKLDVVAESLGLLTLTQLQNAIRLSTDKKDKICIISDKVIVLATKEEQKGINSIIAKIKSNLPSQDPGYLQNVTQYISVFAIKVDDTIQNAESIMEKILYDNGTEKNKLGIY